MNDGSDARRSPPQREAQRRPYHRPRLTRLGTLTELTALVGLAAPKTDTHGTKTQ